uniref:Glia maturation factor gamma n=1 Tax=Erpetoichthys calabaricus TaxID=27687 RepID=A0A8C4RBL1_ERPCA
RSHYPRFLKESHLAINRWSRRTKTRNYRAAVCNRHHEGAPGVTFGSSALLFHVRPSPLLSFQDISPDELKNELPERQPRFVVYSYKYVHDDGRISFPLCFIFSSPVGCKPEQQMMYAGSKNRLVQAAELTKVFEIRTTEDLTEDWLKEKLSFFR